MKNFSKFLTLLLTVMLLFVSCSDDKDLECVHSYDLQANGTLICSSCNEAFTSPYIGKVNNGKVEILKAFITTGELKTDEKAEFVIYSNGGDVKINAPKATVTHFGKADNVDIVAVAPDTYIGKAEIKKAVSVLTGHIKFAVDVPSVIIPAEAKDVCISQHEEKGKIAKLEVKSNVVLELPVKEVTVEAKDVVVTLNEGAMVETLEAKAEATGVKVENFSGTDIKTAKNTTPTNYVAKIGTKGFESLEEAINAVQDNQTIVILKDIDNAVGLSVDTKKTFTIDFGGHTYIVNKPGAGSTGTQTQAFQLKKGQTIIFKNGTIKAAEDNLTEAQSPAKNIKRMFQSYANVTFENMVIDGTYIYENNAVIEFACGNVLISGNTSIKGKDNVTAINVDTWKDSYPEGAHVIIDTTGTIGDIYCYAEGDGTSFTKSSLTIKGGTFNKITSDGSNNYAISISGGTFSSDPTTLVAVGYTAKQSGSTWVVSK